MYCPKCGRVMSVVDGWYTCVVGEMQLSKAMEETLTARFPEQKPRREPAMVGASLFRWFCPGCGVPLDREMKCDLCGETIRDQHYHLVELHPHLDK
jgi:hypothetical protein